MECLDELSPGIRGKTTGKDMDHPPVTSPTTADQMAPLLDVQRASFDVLWETLIYLTPAIKQEQDPTSSKFISHSWDLLLGVPLYAVPPTSELRQHIQMPCHLDIKPDFMADFHLPSPIVRS